MPRADPNAPLPQEWVARAEARLREAGNRSTLPRSQIIATIGQMGCAITADELSQHLRRAGEPIGSATVYRNLEILEELGLLRRLEIGDGVAHYDPALPGGPHHHHYVCTDCGRVLPFEDERVERAIAELASSFERAVDDHELILRGSCGDCTLG